jgi:hypothetical protein
MGLVLGIPANVLELNQKGLIERAFHDGLYPNLAFRAEALAEEWPANTGTELFMTRPGLLTPVTKPIKPGTDPTPQTVPYEQWVARLDQVASAVDTHMPTSITANANLFLRNIHQLGLQAGQSVNRMARNAMFLAYISGQTTVIDAGVSGDSQLHVSSLNGFADVVIPGGNVAPKPVSSAYPLPVTIQNTTPIKRNVIGVIPDDPNDPNGPGIIQFSATLGASVAARIAVVSAYAPTVIRSAGGFSVDSIGAGDTLTLQLMINAVAILRNSNVQPHEDGFYHAHVSPLGNAQFFADPVFQRLNQSLPEHVIYKEGFIGTISQIAFFMNTEAPGPTNTGTRVATGTSAFYSQEIGGETTNNAGVNIGHVLITGKGCVYEKYLDESQFVTEAGLVGKVGEFDVVNNGISVLTERIRLYLRAPLDRLGQVVSAAWSISTSFPTPSDITAPSGPQRFKRALVVQHSS